MWLISCLLSWLQMSEDIDLQSSMSHLHVAWFGFQHVDQPVSYELAVGTAPGNDDVVGFKHVGALSKRITNLALQPFKVVCVIEIVRRECVCASVWIRACSVLVCVCYLCDCVRVSECGHKCIFERICIRQLAHVNVRW